MTPELLSQYLGVTLFWVIVAILVLGSFGLFDKRD